MIIDFEDDFEQDADAPRRKVKKPLALLVLAIIGALFLQNTLASNISLGSGSTLEFGQGVQVVAACSGNTTLTLTPNAAFVNAAGAGSHYLKTVTVSGIPSSCYGVDFIISAYDSTTAVALPIFNTSSQVATIYNNAGTFEAGIGSSGMSVSSGSGTFTVTFTTPVSTSALVSRLTLQSAAHTLTCAQGGTCTLGSTGPGGGTIFYVSSGGFNCGPTFSSTGSPTGGLCHYLEMRNADLGVIQICGTSGDNWKVSTSGAIGAGYKNTLDQIAALTARSECITNSYALTASRATYGGVSDWYVPSTTEATTLVAYAFPGGVPANPPAGYWTSTQTTSGSAYFINFVNGFPTMDTWQRNGYSPRPIRAF
jgi:hypothetical protein